MQDDINWEDAFENYHPALQLRRTPDGDDWRITFGASVQFRHILALMKPARRRAHWRANLRSNTVAIHGAP